eukprot:5349618-Prymnesium_polylepis.1
MRRVRRVRRVPVVEGVLRRRRLRLGRAVALARQLLGALALLASLESRLARAAARQLAILQLVRVAALCRRHRLTERVAHRRRARRVALVERA